MTKEELAYQKKLEFALKLAIDDGRSMGVDIYCRDRCPHHLTCSKCAMAYYKKMAGIEVEQS